MNRSPSIRRAESAGIPQLLATLNQLVVKASQQQERHLVLITGVSGAGKTLVGLQFVYQNPLAISDQPQAVFLSGNGPLIEVLQYALKNRVFVQPVRNFYLQHQVRRQSAPPEHIIVFDEAQRAWDAGRMTEKYGIDQAAGGTVRGLPSEFPNGRL
ncbi:MAG: DNA/RNA helicase domain-containing protein [Cyanobacteria bacterium J06626_18]